MLIRDIKIRGIVFSVGYSPQEAEPETGFKGDIGIDQVMFGDTDFFEFFEGEMDLVESLTIEGEKSSAQDAFENSGAIDDYLGKQ